MTAAEGRRDWWIAGSASITMLGATSLTAILVGTTAPAFGPDVGISDAELGVAASGFWLAAACSAWVIAPQASRWGWRRTAIVGMGLAAVGQLGLAVGLRNAVTLTVLMALIGLTYGVVVPTSNVVVAEEVPRRRHGLLLGMKQGAAPVGGIIAGGLVPLAVAVDWRWAFVGAAAITLLALANTVAVRPRPTRGTDLPGAVRTPLRSVVKPMARMVAAGAGLATMSIAVLSAYSARTLVDSGLSLHAAGLVVLIASVASLGTRLFSGWWADLHDSDGFVPAAGLVLVGGVGMVLISSGRAEVVVPGVIMTFASGWGWPALLLLGILRQAPEATAYVASRFQVGTGIGGACGPATFGFIVSSQGLGAAWVVAALTAVPAAACMFWVSTVVRRHERPTRDLTSYELDGGAS